MPLNIATSPTSTGQPGLMSPVSALSEKMRCFLVIPPSGVIMALKKSAREARSTMGVPVIPNGLILPLACEIVLEDGIAHVALPYDRAVYSVERIHNI